MIDRLVSTKIRLAERSERQQIALSRASGTGNSTLWMTGSKRPDEMVAILRPPVYIFNPSCVDGIVARYQADKLQRWDLPLMAFKYVIEHIPGDQTAWGDLLSRWGSGIVAENVRRTTIDACGAAGSSRPGVATGRSSVSAAKRR